jgi:hypothetical protein
MLTKTIKQQNLIMIYLINFNLAETRLKINKFIQRMLIRVAIIL